MKKLWNRVLLYQYILTSIVLFAIYMISAFFETEIGFEGWFGLLFFQPILAIIFTIFTIIVCFIIGLPIRLSDKINRFWKSNSFISIIGIFIGIGCVMLSYQNNFSSLVEVENEGGFPDKREQANLYLAIPGWFLTGFMALHCYLFEKKLLKNNIQNENTNN